jgi:hypothetical protein
VYTLCLSIHLIAALVCLRQALKTVRILAISLKPGQVHSKVGALFSQEQEERKELRMMSLITLDARVAL